jgi:hypothetical protein
MLHHILFVSGLVLVAQASTSYASTNAFKNFVGKYAVISQNCAGEDQNCKKLTEVQVEYANNAPDTFFLHEVSPQGDVKYPLNPHDETDRFGSRSSAKVEGAGSHFASYCSSFEWGVDVGETLEMRSMMTFGDLVQYSYYYRLTKSADGHQLSRERHYTLIKQYSPTGL